MASPPRRCLYLAAVAVALRPAPRPPRRLVRLRAADLAERLLGSDGAALDALVSDEFDSLDAPTMSALGAAAEVATTSAAAARAMLSIQTETERRMSAAREKIEHVLDAGELLEMDRRLTSLFKSGQADAALLLCLNANAAAADPSTDKGRVLEHLYTRAQEEFEKKTDPARAVLHKLCRQPDQAIRANILADFLAPQTELVAPDATRIPLETPMPAKVDSAAFSRAVADAVDQLRSLDADGDLVRANIECCRQVAIEARAVLVATAPPEAVRAFEEDLSKTWPIGTTD